MPRGRKSTPKAIAALRGEPGKRTRRKADPTFETAIPTAPDYLEGTALNVWHELTAELAAKQIITNVDQHIIAVYCQAVAQLEEYTAEMKGKPKTILSTRGISQINPLVKEMRSLRQEIAKYASEIGITPTARNKVRMVGGKPPTKSQQETLAEKLFRGAKVKT